MAWSTLRLAAAASRVEQVLNSEAGSASIAIIRTLRLENQKSMVDDGLENGHIHKPRRNRGGEGIENAGLIYTSVSPPSSWFLKVSYQALAFWDFHRKRPIVPTVSQCLS